MRSPARSPARSAGLPGCTSLTFERATRTPNAKTIARSATAKRRFVPGPAKMTATRFQVWGAPVRVAAERVPELAQPTLRAAACRRRELHALHARLEGGELDAFGELSAFEPALHALDGPGQFGCLVQRAPEVRVQVGRRGPVHPGDLHVATERDRSDAVLDAAAVDFRDRGREAEVEPPRAHPERARDEEVAGLVDQHEQREAEDRDEPAHAPTPAAIRRAAASASDRSARSRAGAPSDGGERLLHRVRDPEERETAVEECLHSHLVRSVEHTGEGTAALPRLAREPQQGERLEVGRLELERRARQLETRGTGVAARSG